MRSFTEEQLAILRLASIEEMSYRQRRAILDLTAHPQEIFRRPAAFANRISAIGDSLYGKIADAAESFDEERFLRYLEKVGASVVFHGEPDYPERLNVLDDAPILLFYKGDMSLLGDECFAIVGTRAPTRDGRDVTEYFADELSEAGFIVVSGLARGVDAIAHRTVLDHDRRTIAVIGCGIDKVYPAENKDLYDRIAEKGLILSEYFLGAEPLPFRFPERNRLISALSVGVLVTEAGIKSGTMITVDCALDQNRDVFLVPGNIFSAQSKGANEMLHNPQCLIATSAEDILGFYKKESKRREDNAAQQLTADEALVYAALSDDDRHFEELLDLTGLTMGALMATLTNLEVLGVIKKLPGNYYGL